MAAAAESNRVEAVRHEHQQVEAALKAELAARQDELRDKHRQEVRLLVQEHEDAIAAVRADAQNVLEVHTSQAQLVQAKLEAQLHETMAELTEVRATYAAMSKQLGTRGQVSSWLPLLCYVCGNAMHVRPSCSFSIVRNAEMRMAHVAAPSSVAAIHLHRVEESISRTHLAYLRERKRLIAQTLLHVQ